MVHLLFYHDVSNKNLIIDYDPILIKTNTFRFFDFKSYKVEYEHDQLMRKIKILCDLANKDKINSDCESLNELPSLLFINTTIFSKL